METGLNNPEYNCYNLLGPRTTEILGLKESEVIKITNWWKPGGAETYIATFSISHQDGSINDLIAKSCIKLCPKETMDEWIDRRNILSINGVHFPEIYTVDGATIVEEYIPYSFKDAYKSADQETKEVLRTNFIDTYKRIWGAGFSPVSMHDVRSRGDDVVMIDLGEDLGGHRVMNQTSLSVIMKAETNFRSSIG